MVAYSFQERFRLPILAGTKRQTIRADRKRHALAGEQLQLYTGMRTKHCDLVARATCAMIEPIRIVMSAGERCTVEMPSTGSFYSADSLDRFARLDGFEDWGDMLAFWKLQHPALPVFAGVRIMWSPLAVEAP